MWVCHADVKGHILIHSLSPIQNLILSVFSFVGIVVSPSDGASSDSCLKSSSSPTPTLQAAMGDMSTLLASGAESGALVPAGAPLALSSHLLPQAQGSLPAASFQEGRRASDTSLTQGNRAWTWDQVSFIHPNINFFHVYCVTLWDQRSIV